VAIAVRFLFGLAEKEHLAKIFIFLPEAGLNQGKMTPAQEVFTSNGKAGSGVHKVLY
jgi:hypothetical protein